MIKKKEETLNLHKKDQQKNTIYLYILFNYIHYKLFAL